jgi:antitoxin component of RelBE/YafQ-DinJ toxin-antitoxin module
MKRRDIRVRLDDNLLESAIESLDYHRVENLSQLVRMYLKKAVKEYQNRDNPESTTKKVEFRV